MTEEDLGQLDMTELFRGVGEFWSRQLKSFFTNNLLIEFFLTNLIVTNQK